MSNNKRKTGVSSFLSNHAREDNVSFHMPGHKGSEIYRRFGYGDFLEDFPDRDITEITGADNLFQPESIIVETMAKYRRLYNVPASYLLINGSSGGLIASIMTCVEPGGKLIMARNCHKSVFNALRLGDITPIYAYPEMVEEYGISGALDPRHIRELVEEHPDAKAIVLPSPNYYGICSDIRSLAGIAHETGMKLIVDQAHGAHLKFFENSGSDAISMPASAESSGADLVINSTHKTLCSLTQSALLNVCPGAGDHHGDPMPSVDTVVLEDRLQMIQSTSPSYILMESLDINAEILREHCSELIGEWQDNLVRFHTAAKKIPGLKVMDVKGMDNTKINLDMSSIGLDGAALDRELMKRGIYAELNTGIILMCMTGIGNTRGDYDRLLDALTHISEGHMKAGARAASHGARIAGLPADTGESPWAARRRWAGIPAESEYMDIDSAAGHVCASSLIPYPPGIPLVCPGEVITQDDVDYIRGLRDAGEKVIGIDSSGRISVGS